MNLGEWLVRSVKRGLIAGFVALVAYFAFTESAKALLHLLFEGVPLTFSSFIGTWLSGVVNTIQGDGLLALGAVFIVASVATIYSYTKHNLLSKNFDPTIGIGVAIVGVFLHLLLPRPLYGIPTPVISALVIVLGLGFVGWQSKDTAS